jgi:hypothetical protein
MRINEKDYLLTKESLTLDSSNCKTQGSSRFWGKCIQMASVLAIGVALSTGAFALTSANLDNTSTPIDYLINPVACTAINFPAVTGATGTHALDYYYGSSGTDTTGLTDNQGLVTLIAGSVTGGTATPGTFTYTPAVGFHGMDTFTYYMNDGTATSVAYTVNLLVGDPLHVLVPEQDVPFARTATTNALGHFVAAGGVSPYTYSVTSGTTTRNGGTLSSASVTNPNYTPADAFYGHDTFNYAITDSATPPAMISGVFDIYVELPGFAAAEKETLNVEAVISGSRVLGIEGGGTVNLTNPSTSSLNTNNGGVYVHNATLRLDTTAQQRSDCAYRLRGMVTGGNRVTVDGTVSLS